MAWRRVQVLRIGPVASRHPPPRSINHPHARTEWLSVSRPDTWCSDRGWSARASIGMDGQVPATGDASAKRVGGLGRGATSTSSAGPRGRRGASPERDAEVARRGRAVWGYSFLSRCVSALARVEGCRHRYGVCLGEGSLYSFQPEPGRWREPNTSLFGVQFLTHLLLLDRAAESQMSLSACCVYVSREPLRVQQMVEPPARVLSLSGSGSPCTRAAVFPLARDVKPSAVFSTCPGVIRRIRS